MKTVPPSRAGKRFLLWLCLGILSLLPPMPARATVPFPGTPYCSVPPGPGAGVRANLLLMLDNSASMYDLAYSDPSAYCVDDSYSDAASYSGYFDPKTVYRYATDRFVADSAAPLSVATCSGAPCVASTPYLYIEISGTSPKTLQSFKASGNFLNWLAMSKLDIEKKVLTGGKYDPASGLLTAESRGCRGKKFVKIVKGVTELSFGVSGPIPYAAAYKYENLPSNGGETGIAIYEKRYQQSACAAAVADWKAGNYASFRLDVRECMGVPMSAAATVSGPDKPQRVPTKEKIYLDIRSGCYFHPDNVLGFGTSYSADAAEMEDDCMARYLGAYGYTKGLELLKLYEGDDFCDIDATHPQTYHDGAPDIKGFIGVNWDLLNSVFKGEKYKEEWEAKDYCGMLAVTPVAEPSVTAGASATGAELPAFVLDAGLYGLGQASATLRVRVQPAAPPTGLVQEFSDDINFGAMTFNATGGSGAECAAGKLSCGYCRGYTGVSCSHAADCVFPASFGTCKLIGTRRACSLATTRSCSTNSDCTFSGDFGPCDYGSDGGGSDGGRIISYINDAGSPVGDHGSGLIAAIDSMSARSWTPLAEAFYDAIGYFANRGGLRLQEGDFDAGKAPSKFSCQRNDVLIVSDGVSTADRRPEVEDLVSQWRSQMPETRTTAASDPLPPLQGSYNLDDLAWLARNRSIADFSRAPSRNSDFISTYVVYTGPPCGSYDGDGNCTTVDEGVPEKMMQLAAAKGGGRFARAGNPAGLEAALRHALQDIAAGSGTDATILSNGNGNGALFLREQFYPSKSFDGGPTSAYWIGEMQSLWYYIDPFLGGSTGSRSTIREDTESDLHLNLSNDRVVDPGAIDTVTAGEQDQLKTLWRAGQLLWKRDADSSPRSIRTTVNGTSLIDLAADNAATLAPYLNLSADEAPDLIRFVQGGEPDGYRKRTVKIRDAETNVASSGVWKLGDIISSTPQLQTPVPLGAYHLAPPKGYGDASYARFLCLNTADCPSGYRERGMVYVGANDGMLHAFNLGKLESAANGEVKATLTGSELGREEWAFVPRNALPYLKYLADPNYRHLYYVDGPLTLVDASIRDYTGAGGCARESYDTCVKSPESWMTVLIGGMGLGGATAKSCPPGGNCVPTPRDDPAAQALGLGYSSYFALDVTDPHHPSLLWEFSDPTLGYATSGPAIVRVGERGKNGRWFAVFASGPTGSIDTISHQFLARSDQPLRLFVVDLRSGALVRTIGTGIDYAFGGSLVGGAIDADRWDPVARGHYQDDAVYLGYVKKSSGGTWTDGGVLRLFTNESLDPGDARKPWATSSVMDGIGPVTGGIAKLQDRRNYHLWLYFGLGRYFFSQDDMQARRALYGVKEPCYNDRSEDAGARNALDPACSGAADVGRPGDALTGSADGWRVDLSSAAGTLGAERVVGTPTAITAGAVFFPSFQPGSDPCFTGNSYLWGVAYDSGAALPEDRIFGKALLPSSTGTTHEAALERAGGRGAALPGRPGGAKVVTNSGLKPLKRVIQIQER